MNYNDFPILSNDDYKLMEEHFENKPKENRLFYLSEVLSILNIAYNTCIGLSKVYNQNIRKEISKTKNTVEKIKNNLSSIFNNNHTQQNWINKTNIFNLLNILIEACKQLNEWAKMEEKAYYKTVLFNSINDIYLNILNILKSLEKSTIHFYKHM